MNSLRHLFTSAGVRALARLTALLALAAAAQAAPILTPTTTTYDGIVSGGNFTTGEPRSP